MKGRDRSAVARSTSTAAAFIPTSAHPAEAQHQRTEPGLADGRGGQGSMIDTASAAPADRDALGSPAIDGRRELHSRQRADTQDQQHRAGHGVGHPDAC
jgi:hypothetical protein